MKLLILSSRGGTLTEYSLIIGLFAILTMTALQFLGESVSETLGSVKRSEAPLNRLSTLDFSGSGKFGSAGSTAKGSVVLSGKGYYQIVLDPATGLPTVQLTNSTTGTVTNATSIEGSQWNLLGQLRLAKTLDEMAQTESDPEVSAYLAEMARYSYYLGVAEGEIDEVPRLHLPDRYYSMDAIQDINRYQTELTRLMNNPPAGISQETLMKALPLAVDVYNIAHTYTEKLHFMLENPGMYYDIPSRPAGMGQGYPGEVFENLDNVVPQPIDPKVHGMTADQVMPYDKLKQLASQVLNDCHVDSVLVEATWTDAQGLDNQSLE